jgi:hypothetical protein
VRLPGYFRSGGFSHYLDRRDGNVAVYSKTNQVRNHRSYVLVIIEIRPAERIRGRDLRRREVMPAPESLGTMWWTYPDRAEAIAQFNILVEPGTKRHLPQTKSVPSAPKTLSVAYTVTCDGQFQLF